MNNTTCTNESGQEEVVHGRPLPCTTTTTMTVKRKQVSLLSLFAAADGLDNLLMLIGTIVACVHGAGLPVFLVLFGHMLDSMGRLSLDPPKLSAHVAQYSVYLVYIGLVIFLCSWIGVAVWMQTGERQTGRLRLRYLEAVLKKDISYFDTEAQKQNLVFHISSDAILVQDAIGDKIGHSVRYFSQFVVGFLMGFMSEWRLTLVTLAVVPLLAAAGLSYTLTVSTLSNKAEVAYAESGKVAEEAISQIHTVHSYVGEHRAVEKYSQSLQIALKLGKKTGVAKGIGIGFTYGLMFCSWALFLWYASILVTHGKTNGAKAFVTISNVVYSGFALGQAASNLAAIGKGRAAVANIISMLDPNGNPSKIAEAGVTLQEVQGKIEFREVYFSYPSRRKLLFEGLSFSIASGTNFAIVGPSGSGKSTIISLVQRFYEPSSGSILLDGHDVRDLQLNWLREQIGLVNQEPVLFATTIAENILYGKEDASMEQVVEVAKAANAHSFIQSLPDGYNTQVGDGGAQLSGGQKQTIAIARALIRDPKVLLLDEATSALDAGSELVVQKALDNVMSGRTTIIVAHRLSTIRSVDHIMVLCNGRVVECGSHTELMSKKGEYATLVSLQASHTGEHSIERQHQQSFQVLSSSKSLSSSIEHPQGFVTPSYATSKVTPSLKELVMLNKVEFPYAVLGSLGAVLSGAIPPLFALGITHILTIFYSDDNAKIKHDVEVIAYVFIGAAIITVPIYVLQHYYYTFMGERITARVRLKMFSAILWNETGWFDFEENSVGSLTSKLGADATLVRTTLVDRLSVIVQNTSLAVVAFVIGFSLSWRMAALTIAMYPLLIAAAIAEQSFLKGFGGDYSSSYSKATALARESISNIRIVAAFGAQKRITTLFSSYLHHPRKQFLLQGHISGFCYGLSQLLCFCSYAITLWYGSTLMKTGKSEFGSVVKSFIVLIVTVFAVAEAFALSPEIVKGSEALGSVFGILKRKPCIDSDEPGSRIVEDVKGYVEFRDVSFSYPTRPGVLVLHELNLKIQAGKSVAVVGKSGSGKSTLISLVLRFYDPVLGVVMMDGIDIRTLNLKSLRRRISLVQQEPPLFSSSIYDNIRYGNENATEIEIIEAAKAANAHEFIIKMPDGYRTLVGEKGCQLSGGQKQRVAIARAILKDPSVLLLDEATSALDSASEKAIQDTLVKLMQGRTTIIVAHRLSSIRDANSIAVLQHGKVAEIGSHKELVSRPNSIYAQLVTLQQQQQQRSSV